MSILQFGRVVDKNRKVSYERHPDSNNPDAPGREKLETAFFTYENDHRIAKIASCKYAAISIKSLPERRLKIDSDAM